MAPAGRVTRRMVMNENDVEHSAHMTRSKAASQKEDEPTKGLQARKAVSTAGTTQPPARRRAALGDVSNVTKIDNPQDARKKVAGGKGGLASKAAQPTGVQKNSARTASSRTALSTKEPNKKLGEKRSGPGAIATVKRKVSATASIVVKEEESTQGELARKKPQAQDAAGSSKSKAKAALKKEFDEGSGRGSAASARVKYEPAQVEPAAPASLDDDRPEQVKLMEREDLEDPLMAAEYADEIVGHLFDLEPNYMPNAAYMAHQDDLEWKTRGILIDWLVEVHTRFHLVPETLFLAVNIVDRFLSQKVVQLDRLQLVGITAMFIASKYEEVMSPHVTNFRHVTDDGFTEAEILSAERFILSTLNYGLSYPNPMNFLRRISKADDYFVHTRTIGKYLMEISLLDHRFMQYRPSHVAAAAMGLARIILERGEWDDILTYYSGYTAEEIEPVWHLMLDYLARPIAHEAFFKKYASKKFFKASILTRNWAIENIHLYGIDESEETVDQLD